ncbi:MAG: DUF1512 family protein [Candidatus Aenigmarchaeota archaeon]
MLDLMNIANEGWFSWILYLVFFMVFFLFYPRIMTSQIMWKIERSARMLESMSKESKKFILKELGGKPSASTREAVDRFFEFFLIEPISTDPYGIMKKIEHLMVEQRDRFRYFVRHNAPHMDAEKQASLEMGLAGGITVHMIAKIVRHYVELVRKTKSVQIAMILQMQLPLIESMAKAMYKGTRAMTKGHPIGDGIGPMVAADLMEKPREIADEIIICKRNISGRKVFIIKAKGPGGRLGRPGKAVDALVRKHKIVRIISVDAAAKLEGEKTGSIAEGVGVAMGGPGVERSYIENIAVKRNLPLDSIIVKMSQEQAIMPMRKDIKDAIPHAKESIKRSLARVRKGSSVIIVGVGNTSGIGNDPKAVHEAAAWVDKYDRVMRLKKKKKKDKHE